MRTHESLLPSPVALTQQVSWDDLRLFLAIIERKGIRGAAPLLGMDPSTVSRRLAALEQALGTALFERHPTGLRLTSAGEEAAQFGTQIEDELRELQIRLTSRDTELRGLLRITSAEVIADLSCRLVANFVEQHPGIRVDMRVSDAMANVEKHEVDLAIRVADAPPENLVGRRVGRSAVGLFASKIYLERQGSNLDDSGHSFVEWPSAIKHKPAFVWLDAHFPGRNKAASSGSAGGVLSCCRAGLGIAPLGIAQARYYPELVLLQPLPISCSTDVWLLTHKDLRKSARVAKALEFLAQAFQMNAEELTGPSPAR
jgi:DNA-binding transcriptional LysR family regulator